MLLLFIVGYFKEHEVFQCLKFSVVMLALFPVAGCCHTYWKNYSVPWLLATGPLEDTGLITFTLLAVGKSAIKSGFLI